MDHGREVLKNMTAFSKYARYRKDLKRRENIDEIYSRYENMMIEKYPALEGRIRGGMSFVRRGAVVPSMRALQFAGEAVMRQNNRIYNCSYLPLEDVDAFGELTYLLLGGTGVGYSVQNQHIKNLGLVSIKNEKHIHVIEDSVEGWADAVKELMGAYLSMTMESTPTFDYSKIRPEGAPIHTAGGFAPGPDPIRKTLESIENILISRDHSMLRPIDVFDIACWIAMSVFSGGIRRAATICLFDRDDEEMLDAKSGDFWIEHPQRQMANISAVLPRKHTTESEFCKVFDKLEAAETGEPGFFWTNDPDVGTNPCAEISLRAYTFCNL